MRVLQTQFLYDREFVNFEGDLPDYPAVSCAWFKITEESERLLAEQLAQRIPLNTPMAFSGGGFAELVNNPSELEVRSFIDSCLYDEAYKGGVDFTTIRNSRIVDSILDQTLVIEESPPRAVKLKSMLGPGSILSIGAMVGYAVAPSGFPLLLLITVPTGIVVIGSAAGIATGLQHGLHEIIVRKFVSDKRRPRASRKE